MSNDNFEDEPGSSDDAATEEIVIYDDVQLSPISFASAQSIPSSSFDVSGLSTSPESICTSLSSPALVDSVDGHSNVSLGAGVEVVDIFFQYDDDRGP